MKPMKAGSDAGCRLPGSVRKALWIAAFVVGLPVLIWLTLYAIGSWHLSRALESARRAGLAVSLAELAPPSIPPERNGAVLFEAAFALHPDPEGKDPILGRAIDRGFMAVLGNDEKHVLRVLEQSSALFEKVRAARKMGSCNYGRSYSGPLFLAPPTQGSAALRTARLLGLQAQAEAGTGKGEGARESFRDLLALADSFKDEPLVLSQIIRVVVLSVALEAVHESVTRNTGKEELRGWLDVVPRPEALHGALQLALRGEFAMGAEFAGRPLAEALVAVDPSQRSPKWLARTSVLAPYWKVVGSNYVERMTRLVVAGARPYPEARAELERDVEELRSTKPRWDLLSVLLIPGLDKPLEHLSLSQARLAVLRTGLEWEIERAEKGRYPEAPATVDPLTGQPLGYDREAGALSSSGLPGKTALELAQAQLVWKLRHPPRK